MFGIGRPLTISARVKICRSSRDLVSSTQPEISLFKYALQAFQSITIIMYSKTTFFALITTVSLSAVEVAFEPEFPCNRGCQKRIQREFHRALLTQKPSPNSVINSPFDFELNRSQRGYGVPPVCVQRTQKINWKTFVEQEICQTVRNTLPECKYRKDDCVKCFGNGTYSTS